MAKTDETNIEKERRSRGAEGRKIILGDLSIFKVPRPFRDFGDEVAAFPARYPDLIKFADNQVVPGHDYPAVDLGRREFRMPDVIAVAAVDQNFERSADPGLVFFPDDRPL